MDQERFEKIDRMLEAVLKLEPEARADFLEGACAGDDELRREVGSLLSKEAEAVLLETPAIAYVAEEFAGRATALFAGQRISHYLIEERIGAGGMGEVWKARDEQLKRDVAIKILPLEFSADPDRVRRFEQEAYTISALKHPNIITIHAVGRSGKLRFIVTELVEGRTLRDYLLGAHASGVPHARSVRTRGSWREAVLIAVQIAGALSAAHTAGVIHRDIKPENVMIQAGGHVKTLDFGIAKWVGVAAAGGDGGDQPVAGIETRLGARPGTLKYMSPEQARGEPLDARTDIFSLGLMLYEMIAGRHPYGGRSDEEIIAALKSEDDIPPVSGADDKIPAALDRIVAKALRKNRDERYQSAEEMLAELKQLKSLIEVSPGEKGQQAFKARNANQLLTQFAVLYDADKKTRMPLGGLWNVWRAADLKAGRLEREMMRRSLIGGLAGALWRALPIVAITMLATAAISVREEWDEKVLRDGHTAAVRRAVFSPDGRLLISVGEDHRVIVWDFARRQRLATFNDHTDRVTAVDFSPDGKWFATASADGSVIAWDAARLVKAAVLPGQRGVVRTLAFSADGRALVTPGNDGRKNIWEVGSWKILGEVPTGGFGQFLLSPDGRWSMEPFGEVWDLIEERVVPDNRPYFWGGITEPSETTRPPFWSWAALSPDGRRMISIDAGGFVAFSETSQFSNPEARKRTGHHRMHLDHGRAIAYSSDGRLAASGAEDVVLWDAIAQKKLARFKPPAAVSSLAFSPNGRWLVSTHADGAILTWDTVEHEPVADFKEHNASVEAVAFAPDGRRIASASEDGSVIVWDAAQGQKEAVLLWHPIRVNSVAFSADGRLLASNDHDGNLALWDLAARRLRWASKTSKRVPAEASYCTAISPDGRWVATSYGVHESGEGRLVYDFRAELAPSVPNIPQLTEVRSLAFSADGRWLVSVTARGDIMLRRAGEWQVVDSLKMNGAHLVSVSLSPDGRRLATGEDEGLVRLWQTQPLQQMAVMEGHSGHVNSVAFSPDGKEIVSAGDDKMVALWDVSRRKLITTIGAHSSMALSVAFSPDGKQIVSGGHDRSVRLYTRHNALWGLRWD